jgi:ATP-dependent helicase Lhr and Lhr-like helicase
MSARLEAWFTERGRKPLPFQREVWRAMKRGDSGLVHAATGAGKTYAIWFAALERAIQQPAVATRGFPPAPD